MAERERYGGPERRAEYGWHLRKELNVGHLLTTLALASGLVTWGLTMDKRLARLEDRQALQERTDERQDAASKDAFARVDARLASIDGKLDKLVDWQMRRYSLEREHPP